MNRFYSVIVSLLFTMALSACSTSINDYKARSPAFEFERFFKGHLCAWGVVRQPSGMVNRKFIAGINATSKPGSVTLDEIFEFDDGERQTREWQFTLKESIWYGRAADVEGQAIGEVAGDTMHLEYALNIKTKEDSLTVSMDDWLHRIDEDTLIGTTDMRKFGVTVGRIDIVIRRDAEGSCSRLQTADNQELSN